MWFVYYEFLVIRVVVSVWWYDAAVFLHLLEHFGHCCLADTKCFGDDG